MWVVYRGRCVCVRMVRVYVCSGNSDNVRER